MLHGYTTPPEAVSYASLLGCGHPTAPLHHPPWAGIADEEELQKLPPPQQPRLTSSSELPTYAVAGQHRIMLHQRRTEALLQPQGDTSGLAKGLYVPPAQAFRASPAFAIRLMAGDGKPTGTQDRTVPCTTAKHQFAMANIMNRLDASPFTRDPTPNSEYCRRTGLGRN